jgi:hypothetical protein
MQHQGPNAAQYATGLDNMLHSPQFSTADKDKQLKLIHDYDTAFSNAEKQGKPLNEKQQAQLGNLLTSPGYYAVNDTTKNKVLELFVDTCRKNPVKIDSFLMLVKHPGFGDINNEAKEIKIIDSYINDTAFAGAIDKMIANNNLSPADQKTALEYLLKGKENEQFYGKVSPEDKVKIMNKVANLVTSESFTKLSQPQKAQAIDAAMGMPTPSPSAGPAVQQPH